jgi:site-specific recombinase XerD
MTALAPILEAFFTDRLMTQRAATPHTIASYRDTFKLLLGYLHTQTGKLPSQLDLTDLDATTIGGFLTHLETVRGNSAATRNNRLAAIHSLFRYTALRAPEHLNLISRVLAIQANAPPRPSSATSPALNSTCCCPRRTAAPGMAVVTMPCSWSPPRPDSVSPS